MKKTIPQAPIRISRHLLLYISVFFIAFAGCHAENEIMSETDFSIEGKAYHWEGLTLHTGKILCIDGKKFLLPEEVNEMHGNAWTADFNGDGKAEVAIKTAADDYVKNEKGRVCGGSEYLSVLDGMTGKEID